MPRQTKSKKSARDGANNKGKDREHEEEAGVHSAEDENDQNAMDQSMSEDENDAGSSNKQSADDGEEERKAQPADNVDADADDSDDGGNSNSNSSRQSKHGTKSGNGARNANGSHPPRKQRQKKRKDNQYRTYIYHVIKQVYRENMSVSKAGMEILNSFIADMFAQICTEANQLMHYNKSQTIRAREIETATKLVLSGELSKHACEEGRKAVLKYMTRKKERGNGGAQNKRKSGGQR